METCFPCAGLLQFRWRRRCASCYCFHLEISQIREAAVEVDNVTARRLSAMQHEYMVRYTHVLIIMLALNRWVSISPSCLMMDRFDSGNKVLQADKQISSWAQTNGMFWSTGVFREMTRSRFLARPTRCAKDENPRSLSEDNSLLSYSRRVLLGGIC